MDVVDYDLAERLVADVAICSLVTNCDDLFQLPTRNDGQQPDNCAVEDDRKSSPDFANGDTAAETIQVSHSAETIQVSNLRASLKQANTTPELVAKRLNCGLEAAKATF